MKAFDYDSLITQEKIFGLEITEDILKVMELKRQRGGKLSIHGFSKKPLKDGAIIDCKIVENEEVAETIRDARERAKPHRIKGRYAGVILPDSKIFIRVVKFPVGMDKDEIREAIEWKAKDLIAMPLEKVYWDWHRLHVDDESIGVEVVISAVDKECVDSYVQMLRLLGIMPIYFDVSGNAVARFLFQDDYKNKKALLIRIDERSTTLSLFVEGGVRYQTMIKDVVKGGYATLVDHASAWLGVSKEKAEELILSPENLNDGQKKKLDDIFKVSYDGLMREVDQVLEYYSQTLDNGNGKGKAGSKDLERIFVYGKGARVYYLKEFFESKSIQIQNTPLEGTMVSSLSSSIDKQELLHNFCVLGVSLRNLGNFKNFRDINLVPEIVKKRYLQRSIYSSLYTNLRVMFWSIFIICVILIFSYLISLIYKTNVSQTLRSIQNVTESRANKQLESDIVEVNQEASQLRVLLDTKVNWPKFFQEVSERRSEGILYDDLLISEDAQTWRALSGEDQVTQKEGYIYLVINGYATDRENLQEYVRNMEKSNIFEEVRMPISSYETNANISFSIHCLVNTNELRFKEEMSE